MAKSYLRIDNGGCDDDGKREDVSCYIFFLFGLIFNPQMSIGRKSFSHSTQIANNEHRKAWNRRVKREELGTE